MLKVMASWGALKLSRFIEVKKKHHHPKKEYFIFFLLTFFLFLCFYKQILDPFNVSFNFADNWWYFSQSQDIYNYFFWSWVDFPLLVAPLYQLLFAALIKINYVFLFNVVYIWGIALARYGMYRFLRCLWSSCARSIIWATIFAFNSLTIYANWFNLSWLIWIPFFAHHLLKGRSYYKLGIYSMLLILSGHYYIMLWWILLCSYIVLSTYNYTRKISNGNESKKIFISILWFLLWSIFYIVPIFLFSSLWELRQASLRNQIQSTVYKDPYTLTIPNNQNFITNTYLPFIYKDDWQLRYSHYYWLVFWLIFLYSMVRYFYRKKPTNTNTTFALLVSFISLSFFLGQELVIGWFVLWWWLMPFDIFQYLWVWWIFRKSVYFFYTLTFGLALLIVQVNKKHTISTLLAVIISFALVLENNMNFDRDVQFNMSFDYDLLWSSHGSILSLPNSWFNIWRHKYIFGKKNIDIFHYPDLTIPWKQERFKDQYSSCKIRELLLINWGTCDHSPIDMSAFFNQNNITHIVLFKHKYPKRFFYSAWKNDNLFSRTRDNIEKNYWWLLFSIFENNNYIVYQLSSNTRLINQN